MIIGIYLIEDADSMLIRETGSGCAFEMTAEVLPGAATSKMTSSMSKTKLSASMLRMISERENVLTKYSAPVIVSSQSMAG